MIAGKGTTLKILALDMSSTHIGICYDGREFATIPLGDGNDIARKCDMAQLAIAAYLRNRNNDCDLVAIEAPFLSFKRPGGAIPQIRVSGAVLSLIGNQGIVWYEFTPTQVKKALVGRGNKVSKREMIDACELATRQRRNEHEADAYGVWLAASALRVESEAA